jgi:hypothetical protein
MVRNAIHPLRTIRKSWKTRTKMLYVDFSFTLFRFEAKCKQDPTKTKIDPGASLGIPTASYLKALSKSKDSSAYNMNMYLRMHSIPESIYWYIQMHESNFLFQRLIHQSIVTLIPVNLNYLLDLIYGNIQIYYLI